MHIKIYLFVLLFFLTTCKLKHSDIEICFGNVQSRIKSDSLLKKIADSPLDCYREFAFTIDSIVNEEAKSSSICSTAINKFLLEHNKNSNTVNNLILFQQFQAYLKDERFNYLVAEDNALKYEAKFN